MALQFSLRLLMALFALLGLFLALVRISDVTSACMFLLLVFWLLSPLWVTFFSLYLRNLGWRAKAKSGVRSIRSKELAPRTPDS